MSPEFELLLNCLRLDKEPGTLHPEVKENIDWNKWKALLIAHSVLPQVYKNLKDRRFEGVPEKVLGELKGIFYSNTSRNTRLCTWLTRLIKSIRAGGTGKAVTVIPFKGPVLALYTGNDDTGRSYQDLDVLVYKNEFSRLYDNMEELGYHPIYSLNKKTRKWWAVFGREFVFSKENVYIDVHFRIQRGPEFIKPGTGLMEEYRDIKLMDYPLKALSPEYSVLAICINGTKDGWNRLSFLLDLSQLIRNNRELKWEFIITRSKRMKVYTMLCIGLKLSNELLGLSLPKEITGDDLENKKINKLSEIYKDILVKGGGKNVPGKRAQRLEIRSLDTVWAKFRYFCYYLFVPKISDLEDLSVFGIVFPFYLYLVLRPILLFSRMVRGVRSGRISGKGITER